MTAAFGIDHPLLATRDIAALRARLIALGFTMTAIGKHPWGTSTSLAMFQGCLLEIMGLYDESLIDTLPAGDFRFGRHIASHLAQREGIALTALHSTNWQADATRACAAGLASQVISNSAATSPCPMAAATAPRPPSRSCPTRPSRACRSFSVSNTGQS